MAKPRLLTFRFVLLVLFVLPLVAEASTFVIPQGMDFVIFVPNLPKLVQLLRDEWILSSWSDGIGQLPAQIALFGKVSMDLEKLDLTALSDYQFDESTWTLKDWPVVFVLPKNTSEELLKNFLWLIGLSDPQLEQVSGNYWRVGDLFDSGVLIRTENGIYVTFSKLLHPYLELFSKDKKLSVSVDMPDEPLISYKFFNDSPIGTLLYLLGDAHGRPRHETGSLTTKSDGSLELKVNIYRELSELERKIPGKTQNIDDHTYLADANFYFSSAGFLTPLFMNIMKQAFPLAGSLDGLESFALSAQMTDEGKASSAMISLKFRETKFAETLNTLRKLFVGLSVEERSGTIVVKMGEGKLVRVGDILPKNTKFHLEIPFLSLYLSDESPEVTNLYVKFPSLDKLFEFVKTNTDSYESEWNFEEDWDWVEELGEWDEYSEEATTEEAVEEVVEWDEDETEFWVSEVTEKIAEFVSSYVWCVAEGEEPDVVSLSEEVGLPEDSLDVFKNTARDGAIHVSFVFYLYDPDQVYEAFENLSNLLDLPWNASVTLTYSGSKFIVHVTLERY